MYVHGFWCDEPAAACNGLVGWVSWMSNDFCHCPHIWDSFVVHTTHNAHSSAMITRYISIRVTYDVARSMYIWASERLIQWAIFVHNIICLKGSGHHKTVEKHWLFEICTWNSFRIYVDNISVAVNSCSMMMSMVDCVCGDMEIGFVGQNRGGWLYQPKMWLDTTKNRRTQNLWFTIAQLNITPKWRHRTYIVYLMFLKMGNGNHDPSDVWSWCLIHSSYILLRSICGTPIVDNDEKCISYGFATAFGQSAIGNGIVYFRSGSHSPTCVISLHTHTHTQPVDHNATGTSEHFN